MTQQHEPLFERAAQERGEDAADAGYDALWQQFLDGALTLDEWAEIANRQFPLSPERVAELSAARCVGFWDGVIERMEARRAELSSTDSEKGSV